MDIFFIRHAESEANAGERTSNPFVISLTEDGESSAIRLAQTLNVQPDLIIITSYLRTQQTALPFITKYPRAPVEVWPLHEFTYLSPIACQNTTTVDRLPMVREYWKLCDPNFRHGFESESYSEFLYRVKQSLDGLRKLNKESILVFCHGQVIRLIKQLTEKGEQSLTQSMIYFRDVMMKFHVPNTFVLKIEC